jgi:myo-inositol-1(or 4)-monophosphatase
MTIAREIATKAAQKAGQLIVQQMGNIKLDHKGAFNNLVTDIDRAAEEIILGIIKKEFPGDEILAEESGQSGDKRTNRRWLVDPIDGTTNFAHSYPFFCVSIALEEAGKLQMGVVLNPISNELFWAEAGGGAWLNDKALKVSKINKLEESLLSTGFSSSNGSNMERFKHLTSITHGVRRDGSAALDMCFIACGRTEGYWELRISAWDIGAGMLILQEAGGKVTNMQGNKLDLSPGRFNLVASNGLIHDQLIAALAQSGDSVISGAHS